MQTAGTNLPLRTNKEMCVDVPPWMAEPGQLTPEQEYELVEFMLGKEFADIWAAGKGDLNPNLRPVVWDVENTCWRRDE